MLSDCPLTNWFTRYCLTSTFGHLYSKSEFPIFPIIILSFTPAVAADILLIAVMSTILQNADRITSTGIITSTRITCLLEDGIG